MLHRLLAFGVLWVGRVRALALRRCVPLRRHGNDLGVSYDVYHTELLQVGRSTLRQCA